MGEHTKIEWADHTASFWEGCTKIAPGCTNCYAESYERRMGRDVWGARKPRKITKTGPALIRKLQRKAAAAGRVDTVFVNDLADFFEDHRGEIVDQNGNRIARRFREYAAITPVPQAGDHWATINELRHDAFQLFDQCPNLVFLLLTKRPENIRGMWAPWPSLTEQQAAAMSQELYHDYQDERRCPRRKNVWLGTSVSDQKTADRNIPLLIDCVDLAGGLFVSYEPALDDVDFDRYATVGNGTITHVPWLTVLDWLIVGGESGSDARPCQPEWLEWAINQCRGAGTPVFNKQLGAFCRTSNANLHDWPEGTGLAAADDLEGFASARVLLKHPKGGDPAEWPPELNIRELPDFGVAPV